MATPNMEEMYALLQKQQAEKAKADEDAAKDFNDPNFLQLKQGNAYEMRLMYYTSGVPGDRIVPIIEKIVHAYKDPTDNQYHEVTCPTSEYLNGRQGYRMCPICTELSKLWKLHEGGSVAAKAQYDKFKRKFKGYAVVYVINDPSNPENNGTFKIIYINAKQIDFFRSEIKGVDKKGNPINGARPINFKAYDPSEAGKNLMITVSKDGDWSDYAMKFVDSNGPLNITTDQIAEAYDTLSFDDRYTQFDPEASQTFYENLVLGKEEAPATEGNQEAPAKSMAQEAKEAAERVAKENADKAETPAKEEVKDEIPMETPTETPAKEEAKEEAPKSSTPDINSILDNLPI